MILLEPWPIHLLGKRGTFQLNVRLQESHLKWWENQSFQSLCVLWLDKLPVFTKKKNLLPIALMVGMANLEWLHLVGTCLPCPSMADGDKREAEWAQWFPNKPSPALATSLMTQWPLEEPTYQHSCFEDLISNAWALGCSIESQQESSLLGRTSNPFDSVYLLRC